MMVSNFSKSRTTQLKFTGYPKTKQNKTKKRKKKPRRVHSIFSVNLLMRNLYHEQQPCCPPPPPTRQKHILGGWS